MNLNPEVPLRAIHVNTVGYLPDAPKVATLAGEFAPGTECRVHAAGREEEPPRFRCALRPAPALQGLDAPLWHGDFTEFREPGEWVLRTGTGDEVLESPVFRIGDDVWNESLVTVMKGFYGQRCGCAVRLEHRGQVFAHQACHCDDGWRDLAGEHALPGERTDAAGGWHDAGDYGKYIVNAGAAMGMMLQAWERYGSALEGMELDIPRPDAGLPDFLGELKYNLDWMLKMQFADGKVSHKLTRTAFEGFVMPEDDHEKRYFSPWGTDATAAFAATCFTAARVYRPWLPGYAEDCLQAGQKAMEALDAAGWKGVKPDLSAFGTGAYLRDRHTDREWAWLEQAASVTDGSGDRRARSLLDQDNRVVDVDWDWGATRNLGIYTWLRGGVSLPDNLREEVTEDLRGAADRIVRASRAHPFGRGIRKTYWGANGSIARTVMTLMCAHALTGDRAYRDTALDQLAYLYGRNPHGRSYVTGDGHRPPEQPHHRPSEADGIEVPWPGHLVGGANPGELDWHDETGDFRTNETALNWDAALVFALAAFRKA